MAIAEQATRDGGASIQADRVSPPAFAAFVIYLIASLTLFGRPLLGGGHVCLCVPRTTDAGVYVWEFEWWPHALWHGLNPFYPHVIYATQGINLAHGGLVPGPALILAPITALAGPLSSFNLAMLLAPVLAAFFAFLLGRHVTRSFWPSLVGGWMFGFSTYTLGQLTGHLDLALVFPVPAIVHLVLRALAGEIPRRRFAGLLVLVLILQFSFSVETFASFTLLGVAALAIGYALGEAGFRARLHRLLGPIGLAYLLTVVLVSPYLYYALQPGGLPALPFRTDTLSNDLLAFVVPTQITAFGGYSFLSTSLGFTAGYVEGAAYLGVPLILMTLMAARAGWHRVGVRAMVGTLLVVLLCTLGGRLHVGGSASIPLPWGLVHRLPAFGQMIPARFILYGALICAVLAAMWLAANRRRASAWVLALLSVAFLLPAVERGYWHTVPDLPHLFTTSAYRQAIGPRDIALVIPVGIHGQSMLWQAEAHLGFTMASGYVVPPEAPDPYKRYAIYPTLAYDAKVPHQVAGAAKFLASEHVTVAVLDPHAVSAPVWLRILERLGWGPTLRDGALLLRPNGFVPEPRQPAPPPITPRPSGPLTAQHAALAIARDYLHALIAGDARRLCVLLTPAALAAEIQTHAGGVARCVRTAGTTLRRFRALRNITRATRAGSATIYGMHGYVELVPAHGPIEYLPVRELGRKWRVDGIVQTRASSELAPS